MWLIGFGTWFVFMEVNVTKKYYNHETTFYPY